MKFEAKKFKSKKRASDLSSVHYNVMCLVLHSVHHHCNYGNGYVLIIIIPYEKRF